MQSNGNKWYLRYLPQTMVENARKAGVNPNTAFPGFVLAWIAFFVILNLPPLAGLKPQGQDAAAVAVWAVIIWITEAIPVGVSGLLIPLLLVLTNAQTQMPLAFSGFTNKNAFLVLGSFIFAAIMQSVGLDRRIALSILNRVKPKVDQIIKGLVGVNLALGVIIPAAVTRSAVNLPIVKGIMDLFDDTPEGNRARGALAMTGLCYFPMVSGIMLLTSHMPNVIMAGLFDKVLGYQISYIKWFVLQWPLLGLVPLIYLIVKRTMNLRDISVPGGSEFIALEKKSIGRMTSLEWLVLGVFTIAVLLWIAQPYTKINTGLATLIVVGVFFIPGLLPTPWRTIQGKTMWGTWLLLAGALSLATAISSTGLAEWIAGFAAQMFKGQFFLFILVGTIVLTALIRIFMLSNVAAVAMLAPVLISLAQILNLNPVAFTLLVGNFDSFSFIIPTQVTACVIAYGTGSFDMKTYARVGIPIMIATLIYFVVIMLPWYALNGLPLWGGFMVWK